MTIASALFLITERIRNPVYVPLDLKIIIEFIGPSTQETTQRLSLQTLA